MNIQEVSESLMALPSGPPNLMSPVGEKRERETSGHFPHQPEKALEVYDEAYRKNPHDASLVSRIGQAYVKTHQYTKVRLGWAGEQWGGQPGREEGGGCMGGRRVAVFLPSLPAEWATKERIQKPPP